MRVIRSIATAALAIGLSACSGPNRGTDAGSDFGFSAAIPGASTHADLLLAIDNSPSMAPNHTNLFAQIDALLGELTHPPCISAADPSPHECSGDPDERLLHLAVRDLHVGVISSDLGTPGSNLPGCENSDLGDDGLLNPIRNGSATARHEPWESKDPAYARPQDCRDPNQFPAFLTFTSGTTDPAQFSHDVVCNVALGSNGCGLESQLDSIYRATIIHSASDAPGNTSPNAGFLRADAALGILVLSDEDDSSVRDCRFANGSPCEGVGAIDVYDSASTAWASADLNLRFYLDQPCSPTDPTWEISRYVDPSRRNVGLLSLKEQHPERIVFAAITGVPLAIPRNGTGPSAQVNWDALLGTPSPAGPDDFCGRDSSSLASLTSAEGPVSMAQANPDPGCPSRVVPACRREGSPVAPSACTAEQQYFAWPARRIVEIARRFDESPMCGSGAPCRNGFISSICSSNYSEMLIAFARRIAEHTTVDCLERAITANRDTQDRLTVPCRVRETQPPEVAVCDASRGRVVPADVTARTTRVNGVLRTVCEVTQVAVDANTRLPVSPEEGWFYSRGPSSTDDCTQRISFTTNAVPAAGATARIECPMEAVSF